MERKPVIFVADDDIDDLFLFEEALKVADPSVKLITSNNGQNALEILNNVSESLPDIIFLDINMPLVDGWECLESIKRSDRLAHIPVIIYSTSNNQRDIDRAYEKGAFCFCTKPDQFKILVNLLKLIIANWGNNLLKVLGECQNCETLYFNSKR